jgi:hypothetical protein
MPFYKHKGVAYNVRFEGAPQRRKKHVDECRSQDYYFSLSSIRVLHRKDVVASSLRRRLHL